MTRIDPRILAERLLAIVPSDGTPIGNGQLRYQLAAVVGRELSDPEFNGARDALVSMGTLVKGKGRGGSVRRASSSGAAPLELEPEPALLPITKRAVTRDRVSGGKRPLKHAGAPQVLAYRHEQKRVNNPEVGMVTPDSDPDGGARAWRYDPHIDPALQFDVRRTQVEGLIDTALASGDDARMRAALESLKQQMAPYLNWTGRAERTSFDVDTVSLHVHERMDPATILTAIRKRMTKTGEAKSVQEDFFRAWFEAPLPYREAIDFYKHDRGWANRLVSGDSLLVMNSLLVKEGMAGQVQMIYIDPPYGIRYGSNFQPFVHKKEVKDRKDEDLTQEPEMIKAFRDTWELGIHSYLTYLRDRLLLAKDLLHESGSVFVQIGDENLHHVTELLQDVFGADNMVSLVTFKKTNPLGSSGLGAVSDFLIWFAKDKKQLKFRKLLLDKSVGKDGVTGYAWVQEANRSRRRLTREEFDNIDKLPNGCRLFSPTKLTAAGLTPSCVYDFPYLGGTWSPTEGSSWRTNGAGMERAIKADRLIQLGDSVYEAKFFEDYPVTELTNLWSDTRGEMGGQYVVQTSSVVVERCLLMSTDPGDLVLDPTCGSGTTAFVAETWGRRWITCDTSRVAVTLAKQRLITASYDYYELKYPHEGLRGGFVYKTVPHVTLRSIAHNPEVDEIWERMNPPVEAALAELNAALAKSPRGSRLEIAAGERSGQIVDLGGGELLAPWEVPFDLPEDWPSEAHQSFEQYHSAREAMQRQMDQSIAAHADSETLFDQPVVARNKLRVTGPFTVEAVPFPSVLSLDESEQSREADVTIARSGESARQHGWRDELLKTGIRGKGGQILKFAELDTLPSSDTFQHLYCSGTLSETGERVVVSFGPEYAALEQRQVELAIREAEQLFPRPKMIVFCAFAFDPEAAKDIDAIKGITALKAQMNTDLLTEDLKKARSSNESFWLMGQPDVEVRQRKDGRFEVEVHGFDYFDTAKGELVSGGKKKIAAWSLDTDYDERSLNPRQVFFPMAGDKDGWYKLKKDIRAELNDAALRHLHGTTSLPFDAGDNRKVAVKIVDDRGIESLKVIPLG